MSPRQIAILERLRRSGMVRVSALVKELGVSDMTIRRDLDGLIESGHAQRVYGGATLFGGGAAVEVDFDHKAHRMMSEKRVIAGEHGTTDALVGPTAESALAGINVDLTFLGATGMSADRGVTSATPLQASANRMLMRCSETTILLADHTKWGRAGLASFTTLEDVDTVISDDQLTVAAQDEIRERTTLILA